MRASLILITLILLLLLPFSSSAQNFAYNRLYDGGSAIIPGLNYSINVNSTNNWVTNIGVLGNVNATQFFNDAGILNLNQSWGSTIWCELTGCNMTGDLNVSGDIEGDTFTLDDVTISSWDAEGVGTNVSILHGQNESNSSQDITLSASAEGFLQIEVTALNSNIWELNGLQIKPIDDDKVINISGTSDTNWMEGNLSVNSLEIRSGSSIDLAGSVFSRFNLQFGPVNFTGVNLDDNFAVFVNTSGAATLSASNFNLANTSTAIVSAFVSNGSMSMFKFSPNFSTPNLGALTNIDGKIKILGWDDSNDSLSGIAFGFHNSTLLDPELQVVGFRNETIVMEIFNHSINMFVDLHINQSAVFTHVITPLGQPDSVVLTARVDDNLYITQPDDDVRRILTVPDNSGVFVINSTFISPISFMNNITFEENITVEDFAFFNFVGSDLNRVTKGWFIDIDTINQTVNNSISFIHKGDDVDAVADTIQLWARDDDRLMITKSDGTVRRLVDAGAGSIVLDELFIVNNDTVLNGTVNMVGNVSLNGGLAMWTNGTCNFFSSPLGTSVQEFCD